MTFQAKMKPIAKHNSMALRLLFANLLIFCKKCGSAYNLFIKQEKMCSGKLLSLLFKYFLFLMIMFSCAAAFLILDAYLKTREAQFHPEDAKETYQKLI